MLSFGGWIIGHPVLYGFSAFFDMLVYTASAVLFEVAFFNVTPPKKVIRYLTVGVFAAVYGALTGYCRCVPSQLLTSVGDFGVLIPFISCFIIFASRKNRKTYWQSLIPALICNLFTVPRYFLILLIPGFSQLEGTEAVKSMGIDYTLDLIMLLAAVLIVFVLNRKKEKKQDWVLFLLAAFTVIIFTASVMSIYDHNENGGKLNYFLFLLNIPGFTVTVTYAVRKIDREKSKADTYKRILDEQIKYYEMLEHKNNELRIYRHDFPKIVAPIISSIQNGDQQGAIEVLSTFEKKVHSTRAGFHTGNSPLDAVLESEAAKAREMGVRLTVIPGSTIMQNGMDSVDIYTLFPNLLDNAIEAAQKAGESSEIVFSAKTIDSTCYVTVKNPYVGEIKTTANGLETTKKDKKNHGFGTQSIKKIAEKYGNQEIYISVEKGIFTIGLVLEMKEAVNQAAAT